MFSLPSFLLNEGSGATDIAGNIGLLYGAGYAFHKMGGLEKMGLGAAFSIGGEPIVSEIGYGAVVTRGGNITEEAVRRTSLNGAKMGFTTDPRLQSVHGGPAFKQSDLLKNSRGLYSSQLGKGIMKQTFLSSAIPIASLAYGGISYYSDEGMQDLGKYLVADAIGNYYGTQASLQVGTVANAAKANTAYGIAAGSTKALQEKDIISRIKPMFGSGMLGRMMPTMGGIMGATMGMELGKNLGEMGGSILGSSMGVDLQTSSGLIGGLGGAVLGGKFGAYMTSSLGAAVIGAGALYAGKQVSDKIMSMLESGFQNMNKGRQGLGFAGDTANYFTRNAMTMRERAVQSMHKSHLNARSAFGQEATIMHMNRDMFSQYKR